VAPERLFLAVWPSGAALDVLERLHRPEVPRVRWTTPEQWHVTLRFLGSVPLEEGHEVLSRLDRCEPAVAVMGPAVRRLGGGAVVVDVGGLDALASVVADDAEGRPFHGHVTLARVRGPARPPRLEPMEVVMWGVEVVTLVRSHLQPQGARYEIVGEMRLLTSR
jgi:2'-5' RNA ligase